MKRSFVGALVAVMTVGAFLALAQIPQNLPNSQRTPPKLPALPIIKGVRHICTGTCTQMEITGINFGATQGSYRLLQEGVPLPIASWSDTLIVSNAGWDVDPLYHYVIDNGSKTVSNVFEKRYLMTCDSISPSNKAAPGTEIILRGWGAGTQSGKNFKLGPYPMTILSWNVTALGASTIHLRVPEAPKGSYKLALYHSVLNISEDGGFDFTVI